VVMRRARTRPKPIPIPITMRIVIARVVRVLA
jgi:hypothetical protein